MNRRKSWRLAFCIAVLVLAVGLCNGDEDGPLDYVDELQCSNTLMMVCGDTEHTVMVGVKDLKEEVEGDTRHFRFWDCAMEEWLQSSCSANCTLEMRFTRIE